ncbi:zinc ribbon domain-containing protein [Patescibacteria group bacterium]|nr:zinc ribbon domain-containing protein [Patescibacteria group bacterium]
MPNFCTKCGKSIKAGGKFCTSCGAGHVAKRQVPPPPPPPPPPRRSSGCGAGCAVGCLVVTIIIALFLALIIGGGYYLLSRFKNAEPGDYFEVDAKSKSEKAISCGSAVSCIDNNLKTCSRATGEAELGEFATAEFEVLGTSGRDCVVFAKIVDIKKLPDGMDMIPEFVLNIIFEDLTMECLIPQTVYKEGMEGVGTYIGENMTEVCKGPLFDMAEKYGVDLEN